ISIDMEERPSPDITDAMRNGMADLGVVASSADLQGLETFTFRPDPLVFICARDHALAQRRSLHMEEVAHLDFVGLVAGSPLQEHLAHQARKGGKSLLYRVRLRSLDAVCRMVGLGIGVGIVPKATALRCARSARIK